MKTTAFSTCTVLALLCAASWSQPCTVPDAGAGTVALPPVGCDYLSPDDFHMIIDGLPPGTTIEAAPIHRNFICRGAGGGTGPDCDCGGGVGSLGGGRDCFNSELQLSLTGTGTLAGFSRVLSVPVTCEVHTGPRIPGDPVQQFDTEMFQLQGSLFGDPDFDSLQVVAGGGFGLPSPGYTQLTRLGPPGSDFQVDSFFDITYQIDFMGAPGGALSGLAGSTAGTQQIQNGTCPYSGGCGDCNGDSTITILDALHAAQISVGIVVPDDFTFDRCNVTGLVRPDPSAMVDVIDSLLMAQESVGLAVFFLCCGF